MTTQLYTHTACLEHDMGPMHPERPDRLRAVLHALEAEEFMFLERCAAPLATLAQLALAHPLPYVNALLAAVPSQGIAQLDPDTALSPGSGQAALRAAGAVVAAVDAVLGGQARNGFCAVRPPGHHAEPDHAMGFCLFNNAGVGALHALNHHGLERVAIVDFDVHHGNGSETLARAHKGLFYGSSHQSPLYPGTGLASDPPHANVVNGILPPGAGSAEFRAVWGGTILPGLAKFAPQLIVISAGFDAHRADPLANLKLVEDDFAWVTGQLMALANQSAHGRLVSTLEGGYDLSALARSASAHVRALMTA